jgi:hypothetical protein
MRSYLYLSGRTRAYLMLSARPYGPLHAKALHLPVVHVLNGFVINLAVLLIGLLFRESFRLNMTI